MAKKPEAPKVLYERTYIVPLRHGWLKAPKYRRAKKAIKILKEFIARHMKIYDRDLRKVKIDVNLNNEIKFKGIKKPLAKIKVIAKKYEDFVTVELAEIPEVLKYKIARQERKKSEAEKGKKAKSKEEEKKEETKEEEKTEEQKTDTKEKEQASKDEGMKIAKMQTKQQKHISKDKGVKIQRKALAK